MGCQIILSLVVDFKLESEIHIQDLKETRSIVNFTFQTEPVGRLCHAIFREVLHGLVHVQKGVRVEQEQLSIRFKAKGPREHLFVFELHGTSLLHQQTFYVVGSYSRCRFPFKFKTAKPFL